MEDAILTQDAVPELQAALERGEFELHYQPIVEARGGRVAAVEALLRWRHPRRGLVPPGQFISQAERCGMIVPIGEWVLREACEQLRAWRAQGLGQLRMAVNLSPRQLSDEKLLVAVADALTETQLPPGLLELELTESVVARNPARAARLLTCLRNLGVRTVIDDFGTGYSSLARLKSFPVDGLKIDRSFVENLPDGRADVSIARAIIDLARALNLETVAEGVETQAQRDFLSEEGCGLLQGFLFAAPMPPKRLCAMLGL